MIQSVYIAGPMSLGWLPEHMREAIRVADILTLAGYVPFVPHLTTFWEMMIPHDYGYEAWMDYGIYWMRKCYAVLRLDGLSSGADRECEEARVKQIPVFFGEEGLEALLELKNASTR